MRRPTEAELWFVTGYVAWVAVISSGWWLGCWLWDRLSRWGHNRSG
jgi:hypothetical protein